jgi:hypothetical protein
MFMTRNLLIEVEKYSGLNFRCGFACFFTALFSRLFRLVRVLYVFGFRLVIH